MRSNLKFPIGTNDFRTLITCDAFVDKSLFIKEIVEASDEAILITRPRRYGKTMNMQMLALFFGVEVDTKGTVLENNPNKILFTGGEIKDDLEPKRFKALKITQVDNGRYLNYQGKSPCIFISFKDVKGDSYESVESQIRAVISHEFSRHGYLRNNMSVASGSGATDMNLAQFNRILDKTCDEAELKASLKFLSELLYRYFNRKVYIFIDEYDKAFNALLETSLDQEPHHGLRMKIAELMTHMLSSCGKDNVALEKMILTGIFDMLKKEGNSGFNNVKAYGILNARFSECFGFSEQEINEQLLPKLNLGESTLSQIKQNMKDWYNGYIVPRPNQSPIQIYTPWAVMNYLYDYCFDSTQKPQSYWTRSGARTILTNLLQAGVNADLESKFLALAQGNNIELSFDARLSLFKYNLNDYKTTERVFAYLLLNSGYLTAVEEEDSYICHVPNFEVKKEFEACIAEELSYNTHFVIADPLIEALIKVDEEKIKEMFTRYVVQAFHSLDVSKRSGEFSYHMFTLGLIHGLYKTHIIESQPESGFGRCDIAIIPRPVDHTLRPSGAQTTGFVIEFKQTDDGAVDMLGLAKEGMDQIKKKSYTAILDKHTCQNQVLISVAFRGKEVVVLIEKHLSKAFNSEQEWSYARAKMAKILW